MTLVDEVWGRMEFRTPWSRARERAAVADALARFVAWHQRPGARMVLATEPKVRAEVTLPDGQVVRLHGYADRLELDEDGRVVVVDLKTGKYPPTGPEVERHAQLGLYQLAVDHGAADEIAGRPGDARAGPSWSSSALGERPAQGAAAAAAAEPGDGSAAGRGAADAGRRRAARRGVRGPARAATASAAPSRRSAPTRPPGRCSRDPAEIDTPEQLRDVLGEDLTFSPQQFAAITAPLEPAVVIAGAGSGKTTVMAARVVWLVATGRVAPGEILGLTFTTKATAELAKPGSATACARPGCCPPATRARPPATTRRRSRSRRSRRTTPTPRRCSPSTACGSGTSPTPG